MGAGKAAGGVAAAATAPGACTAGIFLWALGWRGSPFALNLFKCSLASLGFLVVALAAAGGTGAAAGGSWSGGGGLGSVPSVAAGWLAFSGLLGIVVGDNAWLMSLQILGPRRVVFCDNLKPFLAAAVGRWWLGEDLSAIPLLVGVLLTAAGVTVVSLEKARQESHSVNKGRRHEVWGWAAAVANVSLDTVGTALTKIHGSRLTTWEINLVRFGSASLALLLIAFIGNVWPLVRTAVEALPWKYCRGRPSPPQGHELQALENSSSHERGVGAEGVTQESLDPAAVGVKLGPGGEVLQASDGEDFELTRGAWARLPSMPGRDWACVTLGVALTTFLCPALGNYALFLISLPAWATLGALGPMYALPLGWLLKREPVTKRAVFGATLAVAGVVPLALHES